MVRKNLLNLRIGVLVGGNSSERKISLLSGKEVRKALSVLGFKSKLIDVDKNIVQNLKRSKIDLAFLALHGKGGEDGSIQGLLEIVGIPYTGSDILSSAIGMDKIFTKKILISHKIPTPKFIVLERNNSNNLKSLKNFKLPLILKPSNQGSTVGISIISKRSEIKKGLKLAFLYDRRVLAEEFISGREVTVGILGEDVLPVLEIIPKKGFYDFEAKYKKGMSEHVVPARIPKKIFDKAQEIAMKVHNLLGCRDISRVDMIYSRKKELYVLEINTIPGLTGLSLLPDAARSIGIEFKEVIRRMVVLSAGRAGWE